jgi:chemotaxis protein CheX
MDVIAEVTNMIVGNVKNYLEPVTGTLAISIPTVIHGRNFQFRNIAGLRGTTLAFSAGENKFEVRFALAPAIETTLVRSKIPFWDWRHCNNRVRFREKNASLRPL